MNFKIMFALIALMGATRMHHFGGAFSLPDASLAVFFLAGLFLNSRIFFAALLIQAGLLDYVAIAQFNVSDFCISPAYVFLIPTYFAMWFAGRFSSSFKSISVLTTLLIATSSAFLISNMSFYFLSDKTAATDLLPYVMQTTHYYLPYTGYALMYSIFGVAFFNTTKWLEIKFFQMPSHS